MQIVHDEIPFNSIEGFGPRELEKEVFLPSPASQVIAMLTGFNAAFSPSDNDHHLGNLEIRVNAEFIGPAPTTIVKVIATFGLRDWSEEWDDKYEGTVRFAVIAE
jgi:hypothetical protein